MATVNAKRGRPVRSDVRQNIINILYIIKKGYGYDVFRIYRSVYPACTMRLIYYHLKKGIETGEIKVAEIRKEKGNFSWGGEVEKIYYALGPSAVPRVDDKVRLAVDKIRKQE